MFFAVYVWIVYFYQKDLDYPEGVKTMSAKEVSVIPVFVSVEAPASQHDLEDQSRVLDATYYVLHKEMLPQHRQRRTRSADSIASIGGVGACCHPMVSLN